MIGPSVAPLEQWWRQALIRSVHDGDTATLMIDLGFDVWTVKPLRLFGLNAPELRNPDGSGKVAAAYASQWVSDHASHGTFMVRYVSWDKYAPRFDGVLVCGQAHCLNDAMIDSGNAVPMVAR